MFSGTVNGGNLAGATAVSTLELALGSSTGTITALLDSTNAANSNAYGYDNLDHLTSASVPATSYGYSYDLTGNRLTRNAGSATDSTTVANTSNQIVQVAGSSTRRFTLRRQWQYHRGWQQPVRLRRQGPHGFCAKRRRHR